jgi:hypothetical protein
MDVTQAEQANYNADPEEMEELKISDSLDTDDREAAKTYWNCTYIGSSVLPQILNSLVLAILEYSRNITTRPYPWVDGPGKGTPCLTHETVATAFNLIPLPDLNFDDEEESLLTDEIVERLFGAYFEWIFGENIRVDGRWSEARKNESIFPRKDFMVIVVMLAAEDTDQLYEQLYN